MSGSGVGREMSRSRMAEAALTNEQLTRQRVELLERKVKDHDLFMFNDQNIYAKLSRGFWGRLRWLFLGR